MNKSFVKEVFIFILLLILILLILAVALYDFIPANINVPETISYSPDTTTTSIKQEIAYTNGGDTTADSNQTDTELITSLKSYSINSSDLAVYGQKNLYNSGNSNPFDYAEEASTSNGETTQNPNPSTSEGNKGGGQNTSSSGSTSNQTTNTATPANTTSSTSTPGTFFENTTSK